MFAVMKTFVTDISASTGRNDLICGFGMVTCTVSVEAEISVTKVFITANMQNSKSCGKQEVDVR
jgi:hypothetical protein